MNATLRADPRELIARSPMSLRQKLIIVTAVLLNALDGFDVLSISYASPGIAHDWGVDRAVLGIVLSMELVGMAFGAFTLGLLADRIGRRPTTLACLAAMSLGMLGASQANGVVELSALRLFTGLGIGGMLATTNAIVAESANARRRNLAVALMAGGYPMGAVVGGLISTNLLRVTGHWQAIFVFGALVSAAFIPIVVLLVDETIAFLMLREDAGRVARVNRVLSRFGHGQVEEIALSAKSRNAVAAMFAGAMRPVTTILILSYFFHIMTFYFLMKWIPKIVADMGYPPAEAGGVLVWCNVGGVIGAVALSLLTQKVGIRALVIGAMGCGALAVASFGQVGPSLERLSLIAFAGGLFTNGAVAGLYGVFAQSFPAHLRAGGTGLVIGIGRGGAALGPVVAGFLFSSGWTLAGVAPMMAAGSLLGAAALAFLRYRDAETA